ncbi:MAG: phosphotransferase family protein [Actinobacteria bacterium]|nr:phosphotransferase family protein [Actinomycetota bacterium]
MSENEDTQQLTASLRTWLASRLIEADDVEVADLRAPEGTGFSSETYLYTVTWTVSGREHREEQVLRTRPEGTTVFRTYDLESQYRCMDLLSATDVPVPTVRWYEPDASVIGRPFYVMERVDGDIPPDSPPYPMLGWVKDAAPKDQAVLWDAAVEALARLHRHDPQALGLGFLDRPQFGATGLDQQLGEWTDLLQWGRDGRPQPTIDAALEWLRANLPDDEPAPVLNWGDARISNMVFRDHRPVALLDWEMAALGPPEVDLGWFLYMDAQLSLGVNVDRLPGFASREETITTYEEVLGRTINDLHWYEVFAGFRFAITMTRIGRKVITQGHLPDDSDVDRNNLATRYLAQVMELPSPGEPGPFG